MEDRGSWGCRMPVSVYSGLVCARLCTKQRENSEWLLNSHLCRFFSAVHQIHSLPCSVPWRPTLPTAPPSSLATCLLWGPGRSPEGRRRETLASFMAAVLLHHGGSHHSLRSLQYHDRLPLLLRGVSWLHTAAGPGSLSSSPHL